MAEAALPARYEIRIRGLLSETLVAAFPTMQAEMQGTVTMLSGVRPDQAALHGALAQIEALGLERLGWRRCRHRHHLDHTRTTQALRGGSRS